MVKCTTCGNRWRAYQDRSLPEQEVPEEEMLVEAPRAPTPAAENDLEFVAAPVAAARKPEKRKASLGVVVGASVAVAAALVLGGAVVFRQQLAGVVPATAPIFAAIGLPVNTLGLVIDAKSQPLLQGGRPVWSVTGSIRNVNEAPTEAPPIRFTLLDKAGKPVAGLLAQPLNAKIPPGATRYFAVSLPDPPAGALHLDIAFEPPAKGRVAPAGPRAAPTLQAAPVEAQPLAADSPDALRPPAAASHEPH